MKANELRKGNLVNWNGELACVSQIWELEVVFKCGDIGMITDLGPIPLTEEWLIKFGFDYIKDKLMVKVYRFVNVEVYKMTGDYPIYFESRNQTPTSIKFVHQLQNLYFALTGEELTTNN